ncbi:hypothetical protein MPER_10093 [Moniliophthora perniciosa FA553]|nr:hypothetical protein MPER_10093 [Moniliophthora perniciosa FA553]
MFLARTTHIGMVIASTNNKVITMIAMLNSRQSIRANQNGVITVSADFGTGFNDTRDIQGNFAVPESGGEEHVSYEMKSYTQDDRMGGQRSRPITLSLGDRVEPSRESV